MDLSSPHLKTCLGTIVAALLLLSKMEAAEITLPTDWTLVPVTQDLGIVTAGTSPEGCRSAMLSTMIFPDEDLAVMPDPLAAAAWTIKEVESTKGYILKNEKRAKTSGGDVIILTSEFVAVKEVLQTYVAVDGKDIVVLRLILKDQKDTLPSKDPQLAEVLKTWIIQAGELDKK